MLKNPIVTAVIGLLIGFFAGYLVPHEGEAPAPARTAGDPHAGVPGAPSLSGAPVQPPAGGRTLATADPRLLEQARQLETLIASDPSNYTHLVQMGNVQYDLGNYLKARDYYEKARAIRDDSADVLTDLGVCYRETNQPKRAVELFDRAADLAPDHWQSRYNAAVVYLFDLNDPDGAQTEIDRLKSLQPRPADMPDLSSFESQIAQRRQ